MQTNHVFVDLHYDLDEASFESGTRVSSKPDHVIELYPDSFVGVTRCHKNAGTSGNHVIFLHYNTNVFMCIYIYMYVIYVYIYTHTHIFFLCSFFIF